MPSLTPSSLLYLLTSLLLFSRPVFSDEPAFTEKDALDYDYGKYGRYPDQRFKTSRLVAPHTLLRTWPEQCQSNDDLFFIAPRGFWVGQPGPMILDNTGHMVWHEDGYDMTYGLTVQHYHGKPYLTFWTGNDEVVGHGWGVYYMLDENYRQFKKIEGKHGLWGDLHEFSITDDNTGLFTVYDLRRYDLTELGREDGWIWDGLFQEVDLETGELLFEWRATEHYTFDDCFYPMKDTKGTRANGWDWIHINSVQKDPKGNYLLSARYSHAIAYISGKTGEILWQLGGKHNDFKDLSDGNATNMAWQHHARWVDDYTAITVYDNRAVSKEKNTIPSRTMKVKVDTEAKTAELVGEWVHPNGHISESQGSMQILDNGNVFIGYGSAAALSEYTKDGTLVCDMQFGALKAGENHTQSFGLVMSYRSFKHPWVGIPYYEPKVLFKENKMFVSWNGATEVRRWRMEGTNSQWPGEEEWAKIDEVPKAGFESNMTVDRDDWKNFRLTAVDKYNKVHKQWIVRSGGTVEPYDRDSVDKGGLGSTSRFVIFASFLALIFFVFWRYGSRICGASTPWMLEKTGSGSFKPRWATLSTANITRMWNGRSRQHYEDEGEDLPLAKEEAGRRRSSFTSPSEEN